MMSKVINTTNITDIFDSKGVGGVKLLNRQGSVIWQKQSVDNTLSVFEFSDGTSVSLDIDTISGTISGSEIKWNSSVFGAYAAKRNMLTRCVLGTNCKSIGDYAFANCRSLTDITIPDTITSIGNAALGGCYGLTNLIIPSSVTSIGMQAFAICPYLENISILGNITELKEMTLYECVRLTSITLPDTLRIIGSKVFWSCLSLQDIRIPSSVTSIASNAFDSCEDITMHYNGSASGYPWGAYNATLVKD